MTQEMSLTAQSQPSALVLLNLPPKSFAGIDLLSFTTSPRFHGIRSLPPGWHFVFVSPTNSFSIRQGAWFQVSSTNAPAPDVHVKLWRPETEDLAPGSQEQEGHWRANLGGIWREGLTPYRQTATKSSKEDDVVEDFGDWPQLTDRVSAPLLDRIFGPSRENHWSLTSASSALQDEDIIPGLSSTESRVAKEKELGFLPVNLKQTWREGAVGRERTNAARDRTWALRDVIEKTSSGLDEVIGEIQLTFLMVLTLNNHSCLEQWKRLLTLVFTCINAVEQESDFYVKYITTLRLQLEHCQDAEGGLFDFEGEAENMLKVLLLRFRQGLAEISGTGKQNVIDELEELEEFLKREFGWDMNESILRSGVIELEDGEQVQMDMNAQGHDDEDDEEGEFAPVIVDLSPEQHRALSTQLESRPLTTQQRRHVLREEESKEHGQDDDDESEDDGDWEAMDSRY